ncbi:GNAT family N-acetyltransferase [Tardisphaera miroshnichenkoae]
MAVEFKELTEDGEDLKEALRIYEESFRDSSTSLPVEFLRKIVGRRGGPRLGILKEKQVVAMTVFARLTKGSVVWYLAVDRKNRGRGLGSQLVKSVASVLSSEVRPGPEAFLYAEFEDQLISFWEANGFRVIPIHYYQPPIRGTWVRLNLGALPLHPRSSLSGSAVRDFVYEIYTSVYRVQDLEDEYVRRVLSDCSGLKEVIFP